MRAIDDPELAETLDAIARFPGTLAATEVTHTPAARREEYRQVLVALSRTLLSPDDVRYLNKASGLWGTPSPSNPDAREWALEQLAELAARPPSPGRLPQPQSSDHRRRKLTNAGPK